MNELNIIAMMSVPRVGWIETFNCLNKAAFDLGFPLYTMQGVFWGHCMEKGMEDIIKKKQYKYILTVDYDSVFDSDDIRKLYNIIDADPTMDAICPYQVMRERNILIKTDDEEEVAATKKDGVFDVQTGHFGLSLVRISSLIGIPRPLFHSIPDNNGGWSELSVCDDIYFWNQFRQYSRRVCMTEDVRIGHLQLLITWPMIKGAMHQYVRAYHAHGRPEETKAHP